MLSRNAKWLIVMMSLMTAAFVNAAPTIGNSGTKPALQPVSPASEPATACHFPATTRFAETSAKTNASNTSIDEVKLFSGTGNSALANISDELLKPPDDFTNHSALPPGTRPLPAVPGALFMGLTGFLCVTLVRDRKVWLTVVTSILWAGQVGITALPKLASFVKREAYVEKSTRYEIQDTRYAEMEGIPVPANSEQRTDNSVQRTAYKLNAACYTPHTERYTLRHTTYDIRYTNAQFAIANPAICLFPAHICLPFEFRQFTCFSPAFIFESLPRGPPISL